MPVSESLGEPRSAAAHELRPSAEFEGSNRHPKALPISPRLARSLVRARADSRLEAELVAISRDALGAHPSDELPDDCAAWLDATIAAAVASVCNESLAALAGALDARLAVMPDAVARRLHDVELRHYAGYE